MKPLDHQASPLPENPPVRFKKLFALRSEVPRNVFGYLEFSPDGKTLAAKDGHAGVDLFDVQERKLLRVLSPAKKASPS